MLYRQESILETLNRFKERLDKVKIKRPDNLFEVIDWGQLKLTRCPRCGNKLKVPTKGKIAYCKSKKHPQPFLIGLSKLNSLIHR